MGTLKPHSNEPLYRNTVVGTLVADGWAVTFGTATSFLVFFVVDSCGILSWLPVIFEHTLILYSAKAIMVSHQLI